MFASPSFGPSGRVDTFVKKKLSVRKQTQDQECVDVGMLTGATYRVNAGSRPSPCSSFSQNITSMMSEAEGNSVPFVLLIFFF